MGGGACAHDGMRKNMALASLISVVSWMISGRYINDKKLSI